MTAADSPATQQQTSPVHEEQTQRATVEYNIQFSEHQIRVVVTGPTGVGKSTLISVILEGTVQIATGTGRPVTQRAETYRVPGTNLFLTDTKGLETSNWDETKKEISKYLDESWKQKDVQKQTHIVWYLINWNQSDVEGDIKVLQDLRGKVPVIVILSKAESEKAEDAQCYTKLRSALAPRDGESPIPIIPILSKDLTVAWPGGTFTKGAFGLRDLFVATALLAPRARSIASAKAAKQWKANALTLSILCVLGGTTVSVAINVLPDLLMAYVAQTIPLPSWVTIASDLGKCFLHEFMHKKTTKYMIHGIFASYDITFNENMLGPLITLFSHSEGTMNNVIANLCSFVAFVKGIGVLDVLRKVKHLFGPIISTTDTGAVEEVTTEVEHQGLGPTEALDLGSDTDLTPANGLGIWEKIPAELIVTAIIRSGSTAYLGAMLIWCLDKILTESVADEDNATRNDAFCWPPTDVLGSITETYTALQNSYSTLFSMMGLGASIFQTCA